MAEFRKKPEPKSDDGLVSIQTKDMGSELMPKNEGEQERTGNAWTATAHVFAANAGVGVLYLPWTIGQMGWIAGLLTVVGFAIVTIFTNRLLCQNYRSPDPVTGTRNHIYSTCVKRILGPRSGWLCAVAQYIDLYGVTIAYTIMGANIMQSFEESFCKRKSSLQGILSCNPSTQRYVIIFGVIQLLFAQIPGLPRSLSWFPLVAASSSFIYSSILLGLTIAKLTENGKLKSMYLWVDQLQHGSNYTSTYRKIVVLLQAVGIIAYSYGFTSILIEVQDNLESPPIEYKTMQRATVAGISMSTFFFLAIGFVGFAAHGETVSRNLLTGFETLYNGKLLWLVDVANVCIIARLMGGYQMCAHVMLEFFENKFVEVWPQQQLFKYKYVLTIPTQGRSTSMKFGYFRIAWRSVFVVTTTVTAMLVPYFNDVIGFLGSLAYWPIVIYFPIEMYIAQFNVSARSAEWIGLKCLSLIFFIICVFCMLASLDGVIFSITHTH